MLGKVASKYKRGAAGLALSLVLAVPVQAETLAQTLVDAYNNSGLLQQNRAVLRAADEDVATAVAALRPILSWSASASRSFSNVSSGGGDLVGHSATLSLLAEQTLYAGGANRLRSASAKEAVMAARAELVAVEQEVLLRGVNAFMEVRRAEETVRLTQNNVRVISEELRAARDRFEVGEVTRTDVALAEARLAAARSSLASAEGSLAVAKEEYRAVTGKMPGALVSPKGQPGLPSNVEAAREAALRDHPSMVQVQHQVTAAEIGVQIAQAALKPTVTLSARLNASDDLDTGQDDLTRSGSVGITASGPIYRGGAVSSAIRNAKALRDQTRAGLLRTAESVGKGVGQAYAQLRVARASRASFESQVRAAQVAFEGVREEATLGARTTLEVLDAEQELLSARSSLVSAQVDETIAAYTVLSALGHLTAEDLKLPVPSFDPEAYYNLVKDAPVPLSRQGRELDRVLEALGKK